jgi:hypothetical protein
MTMVLAHVVCHVATALAVQHQTNARSGRASDENDALVNDLRALLLTVDSDRAGSNPVSDIFVNSSIREETSNRQHVSPE